MEAAKYQSKRLKNEPRTPSKPQAPPRPLIGSSSTWTEEELDRFNVQRVGNVDPKHMIPEKSFDFSGLQRMQMGITPIEVAESSTQAASIYWT